MADGIRQPLPPYTRRDYCSRFAPPPRYLSPTGQNYTIILKYATPLPQYRMILNNLTTKGAQQCGQNRDSNSYPFLCNLIHNS